MSKSGYVYTLDDPRTDDPKYVGATKDPESRLQTHKAGATNESVQEWINELEREGHDIQMSIVEVADIEKIPEKEQKVIERLSEREELLNAKNSTPYSTGSCGDSRTTTEQMRVHDSVKDTAESLADERGITMKEAVRDVFKEAGYNV